MIDIKDKLVMAYKGSPYLDNQGRAFQYKKNRYLAVLEIIEKFYDMAFWILFVFISIELSFDFFLVNLLVGFGVALLALLLFHFSSHFFITVQEITKEEYEEELKKIEEKKNEGKNKKSFFQRYREYK